MVAMPTMRWHSVRELVGQPLTVSAGDERQLSGSKKTLQTPIGSTVMYLN
jgi:hypothetical protein